MASISLGSSQASVGLDIGTDHIRVAQVKAAGSTFILTGYATVGVPMGAVVEGEIVDVEAVAASIREMVRTSGLHPSNCAIGVSNQKVVVRLIDLPYMERAELQGAIQYQAQDYIPIPIEDAILDFQIIGDYMTASDEHMMEVLLVAAQRDMIGNSVRAVEEAGLKLQQIDVTSFAIVRALMGPESSVLPDEGSEHIVHCPQATDGHICTGYSTTFVSEPSLADGSHNRTVPVPWLPGAASMVTSNVPRVPVPEVAIAKCS